MRLDEKSKAKILELFGKSVAEIALREPSGVEYWNIGPIAEWQPVGDGGVAQITYHDKIKAYAERLVQAPEGVDAVALLGALSLADSLQVERAVRSFFTEAARSSAPATS